MKTAAALSVYYETATSALCQMCGHLRRLLLAQQSLKRSGGDDCRWPSEFNCPVRGKKKLKETF